MALGGEGTNVSDIHPVFASHPQANRSEVQFVQQASSPSNRGNLTSSSSGVQSFQQTPSPLNQGALSSLAALAAQKKDFIRPLSLRKDNSFPLNRGDIDASVRLADSEEAPGIAVEHGIRIFTGKFCCFIACQDGCSWGLCLSKGDWARVLMLKQDIYLLEQNGFWIALVQELGSLLVAVDSLSDLESQPKLDVVLIHGDLPYVDQVVADLRPDQPVLICRSGRGPVSSRLASTEWISLSHRRVGGVTTAKFTFGRRNLPQTPLSPSVVRGTIGHIIKAGTQPLFSRDEHGPKGEVCYSLSSPLRPRFLLSPVVYPTPRICTGWGYHRLSLTELADAFDLPSWIANSPGTLEVWIQSIVGDLFVPPKFGSKLINDLLLELSRNFEPSRK